LTIADIELHKNSHITDKNQIGCYVSLNSRLLDVMVLSDTNYHIRVDPKGETDKISIVFKILAGSEGEPIGKTPIATHQPYL
jgi:hypothetical protein